MARSCDLPRMESETQYFPLYFEEQSRLIPVIIRDEESIPTYFGEVYIGTLSNKYIHLEGDYGVLTTSQIRQLNDSALNGFELNNAFYQLNVKSQDEWIYSTPSTNPNVLDKITVNPLTGDWIKEQIENEALYDHIEDDDIHTTLNEKNAWNRKLNYEIEGETLIFNRN